MKLESGRPRLAYPGVRAVLFFLTRHFPSLEKKYTFLSITFPYYTEGSLAISNLFPSHFATLSCRFSIIFRLHTDKNLSASHRLVLILLCTTRPATASTSFRLPCWRLPNTLDHSPSPGSGWRQGAGAERRGRDHWPPESCSGGRGSSCIL